MTTHSPDLVPTDASDRLRVTFGRVVVSEWRKMVTLRSTWWTLSIMVALHAGIGLLMAVYTRINGSNLTPEEATDWAVGPTQMTQLAIVVLAVMTITSEYATGQIRVSATAVPSRLPILTAKALVLGCVTLVAGVLGVALSVGASMVVGGGTVAFTLSGTETARLLAATPLYLVGIALVSLGVGALIRSTGGTIATMMGLLLVVEQILMAIPFHLTKLIAPWLPSNAGSLIRYDLDFLETVKEVVAPGAYLGPWGGFAVLLGWAVLFGVLAGVRLRSRDV
ncbi:MAG: ABC transporter permease [Micrococcales bacterium]|nr:ABC transporter permease [Micrococcales bacterium]